MTDDMLRAVANYGGGWTLVTTGRNSIGILAQSIGGGGGSGGYAGTLALGGAVGAGVSLGGKGATGADGGIVDLTSHNNILTLKAGARNARSRGTTRSRCVCVAT